MKMSSWIFLMISALLIVSGFFLCNYARSVAPDDEAIDGYTTSDDGQSLSELDYSELNVSKLTIELEGCQVEIRGGAKEAKVQMIGFRPNSFINAVSNKTLQISNQISLLDYLNFDGTGVSFSGVWQTILSFTHKRDSDQIPKVVVYIPDDISFKQFELSFTDCSVRMLGISGEGDLTMSASKSTLEFNQVSAAMVDISCEESEFSVLNSSFEHWVFEMNGGNFQSNALKAEDISITGDEGELTMLNSDFRDFDLKMDNCTITLDTLYTQGSYQRNISVESGDVYLGDLLIGKEDLSPEGETAPGSLMITVTNGKIISQYGSQQLTEKTTEEDSSSDD